MEEIGEKSKNKSHNLYPINYRIRKYLQISRHISKKWEKYFEKREAKIQLNSYKII